MGGLSHRVQQSIADLLPVAVLQAGPAELAPHPHALWVAAVGLGVGGLLAALVAGASLRRSRGGRCEDCRVLSGINSAQTDVMHSS